MMNCRILCICALALVPIVSGLHLAKGTDWEREVFVQGVHKFSANFYQNLAKKKTGNFVSSPVSALIVLSMTAYGACGNTLQELSQTLQLPLNEGFVFRNMYNFIYNLTNTADIDVRFANNLFINHPQSVSPQFTRLTQQIFNSKIANMDFSRAVEAAQEINNWCQNNTNNKIKNVVTPDDLKNTQLLLINAGYFKGNWAIPFDDSVYDSEFYLSENNTVSVPTMFVRYDSCNYGSVLNSTARYIELPYKTRDINKEFSMYIILPNEDTSVDKIGDNIHKIDFRHLHSVKDSLKLNMPKFQMESQFNLKPILQDMGIHQLFDDNADLSKITAHSNLKVDKVVQKAFINVDTAGTEAAAATTVEAVIPLSLDRRIRVNRPFISAIVSKSSGTPLFWARVMDPRSQPI